VTAHSLAAGIKRSGDTYWLPRKRELSVCTGMVVSGLFQLQEEMPMTIMHLIDEKEAGGSKFHLVDERCTFTLIRKALQLVSVERGAR